MTSPLKEAGRWFAGPHGDLGPHLCHQKCWDRHATPEDRVCRTIELAGWPDWTDDMVRAVIDATSMEKRSAAYTDLVAALYANKVEVAEQEIPNPTDEFLAKLEAAAKEDADAVIAQEHARRAHDGR